MTVILKMPALSPTMTHGTLARWVAKEGDSIRSGDVVAEIETDKATLEFEAAEEGVLAKIIVQEGQEDVEINAPIAVIKEMDDDDAAVDAAISAAMQGGGSNANDETNAPAQMNNSDANDQNSASAPSAVKAVDQVAQSTLAPAKSVRSSPLARRLAQKLGLDINLIEGSGPHGRIVKKDVEQASVHGVKATPAQVSSVGMATMPPVVLNAGSTSNIQASSSGSGNASTVAEVSKHYVPGTFTVEPLNRVRRTIASRLQQSKQEIPHFYLSRDIIIDDLLNLRKEINAFGEGGKGKVSVNDLIIRGWAMAMRKIPKANASFAGDSVLVHETVDVSVAVAVAIDGGLVTPVVRGADQLDVFEIGRQMRDYATRAREGKLAPHEYVGGGTSISNLGMYGITNFSAIINPPQATILAIGAGQPRVVPVNGQPVVKNVMTVTLSVDHRVVDGALGAELLAAFADYLAKPIALLLAV